MDENRFDLFGQNEKENTQEPAVNALHQEENKQSAPQDVPVQAAEAVKEIKTEQEINPVKEADAGQSSAPVQQPQAESTPVHTADKAQTVQQKVNSFYNATSSNANGCTYAYARPQQPPVRPQTPPVQNAQTAYSAYSAQRPPYAATAPQQNVYTAQSEQKAESKKKQKKEKKPKNRMSFAQMLLCLVLCLVTGSVAGYVSSKNAVEKTLDSFMETFTTVTTTGSYNINIYEQQADTTAPTVQTQQQDDTTVPVVSNASASDIYKKNVNAVVNITAKGVQTVNYGFFFGSQQQEFTSSGSGFFLTEDGYILTNYHVVEDASTFIATDFEGNEYSAKLVGYEESNDIAVLKVSGTFQAVELGDSKSLEVGDTLLIIGNALGELQYTLTQGVVSYLERAVTTETGSVINMFQTDAAINSGNSGGPVFNAKGEVVGIASAKYASSTIEGLGFCIPIDDVKYMISDIVNVGYVTGKPSVGVSLYTNTSRSNGLPYGCYIVAVEPGSAADNAGLEDGDVITAVDGTSVRDVDDFGAALNGKKAGDSITLTVYFADAGSSSQVTLTLDEYVPGEARTEYSNVYDY